MACKAKYDVIILGGGPAGMSAAIWCADLGLRAILVEREPRLGGQLHRIFAPIRNYPGIAAVDGVELYDRFLVSLPNTSCDLRLGENLNDIDLPRKRVTFGNGDEARASALVIATGVRRRKLGVEGEEEFAGRGILTSGAKEKESVNGSRVVIVGGGDAALENALILSDNAEHVTVVHRRDEFSARPEFVNKAKLRPNVKFRFSCTVKKFIGDTRLTGVEVKSSDGSVSLIDASYAIVRIGVDPNTEIFGAELKLDSQRYIVVSPYSETSLSGVYAIGDVAFPVSPTIATAVGSGATALKDIGAKLEKMHKTTKY